MVGFQKENLLGFFGLKLKIKDSDPWGEVTAAIVCRNFNGCKFSDIKGFFSTSIFYKKSPISLHIKVGALQKLRGKIKGLRVKFVCLKEYKK
jgi:hypothetical protein